MLHIQILTWSIDNATIGGSNLLSHITETHMNPNTFEAINVKRAFQLFSHRFLAAIKTAGYGKQLNTNTWQATADFAERLNDVIDACNSYSLKVTFGGKRPLSKKNPDIETLLINFVQWCSHWSKSSQGKSQIPCFKGFVITVKAILATYAQLVNQYESFELATGLCNQDSVEHLFSKLRQRGGFNLNPTARMVRLSTRHILSTGYIQTSDKGNVQCPVSESLINEPSKIIKIVEQNLEANNAVIENEYDLEDETFLTEIQIIEENCNEELMEDLFNIRIADKKNIESLNCYDKNAVTYFAGFVARRCIEKTNCDNCRNAMLKTPMENSTENEKYIEFREYPNPDDDAPTITKLIRPTPLLKNVIKMHLMAFNNTWQVHWTSKGILDNIVAECINAMEEMHTFGLVR